MSQLNIKITTRMFNKVYLPYLKKYDTRWNVFFGSAGSGKSVFVVQKLIIKAMQEKRRTLVCRKVGSTIRQSTFQLFKDILATFQLLDKCKVTETMLYIELPNGSEFIFMGLDEEQKLLSIQDISDIFVEEATEGSKDLLEQLSLRMRGKASNHQIHLAFNPVSKSNYLYDFCTVNQPKSFFMLKTTYKDNEFLPKEYIEALEDLYRTNPKKATVYCDGNWGNMGQLVFESNWSVEPIDVLSLTRKGFVPRLGGDFGFTLDPTVVLLTFYDKNTETIYVPDYIYGRGLTNPDLANCIRLKHWERKEIPFDSSDPKSIEELRRLGIIAKSTTKGKDSIRQGITFLSRHKIIIDPLVKHLIEELNNYQYQKDKNTGIYLLDKYEGEDHCIDALRYAYADIYKKGKLGTMEKAKLGV